MDDCVYLLALALGCAGAFVVGVLIGIRLKD